MRKYFSIIVLILVSFLFSQNVFAYPQCDSSLTVPCSYPGIGFDFNVVYADTYGDYYFANSNHVQFVDYNNNHYTAETVPWGYAYSVQNDSGFEGLAFYNHVMFARVSSNGFQWFYSPPGNYYSYVPFPSTVSLAVTREPEAGGGVASSDDEIQCGYNSNNYCQFDYPINSEVELTAYPSTGYAFSNWEWNGGASSSTNNPETFVMSEAEDVVARFRPVLQFPLSGTLENRTIAKGFGDDWGFGQCPTGTNKLHAGIDISATANETVKAASTGEIKLIFEDTSQYQWGWCMVIEHDDSYTTTYWHLNDPRNAQIYESATVTKGQSIGTIKDMSTNTHFHFGVRMHTYTSNNIPNAGALPQNDCDIYPAFPEYFIDPSTLTYE